MKTTLEIPDPLFRRVKARAALDGLKLKELVSSALNAYLRNTNKIAAQKGGPCPFPLVRGEGGPLMRRMSNATISSLEEEEDIERHGRSVGC